MDLFIILLRFAFLVIFYFWHVLKAFLGIVFFFQTSKANPGLAVWMGLERGEAWIWRKGRCLKVF